LFQAKEIPGIKILKYTGSLNFVNAEKFVRQLEKVVSTQDEAADGDGLYNDKMLINSISEETSRNERERESRRGFAAPFPTQVSVSVGNQPPGCRRKP